MSDKQNYGKPDQAKKQPCETSRPRVFITALIVFSFFYLYAVVNEAENTEIISRITFLHGLVVIVFAISEIFRWDHSNKIEMKACIQFWLILLALFLGAIFASLKYDCPPNTRSNLTIQEEILKCVASSEKEKVDRKEDLSW